MNSRSNGSSDELESSISDALAGIADTVEPPDSAPADVRLAMHAARSSAQRRRTTVLSAGCVVALIAAVLGVLWVVGAQRTDDVAVSDVSDRTTTDIDDADTPHDGDGARVRMHADVWPAAQIIGTVPIPQPDEPIDLPNPFPTSADVEWTALAGGDGLLALEAPRDDPPDPVALAQVAVVDLYDGTIRSLPPVRRSAVPVASAAVVWDTVYLVGGWCAFDMDECAGATRPMLMSARPGDTGWTATAIPGDFEGIGFVRIADSTDSSVSIVVPSAPEKLVSFDQQRKSWSAPISAPGEGLELCFTSGTLVAANFAAATRTGPLQAVPELHRWTGEEWERLPRWTDGVYGFAGCLDDALVALEVPPGIGGNELGDNELWDNASWVGYPTHEIDRSDLRPTGITLGRATPTAGFKPGESAGASWFSEYGTVPGAPAEGRRVIGPGLRLIDAPFGDGWVPTTRTLNFVIAQKIIPAGEEPGHTIYRLARGW